MTDKKTDERHVAERFYVENPEWTYGRKLVVLASDYDKLEALHRTATVRNQQLQERVDELERTLRIQRERNTGRITVVK